VVSVQKPGPVFVIGSPRSGTSALGWAIGQHERFAAGPETDFLFYLCRLRLDESCWKPAHAHLGSWLSEHDVGLAEFMESIGIGIESLFESRYGDAIWVDATPSNTLVAEGLTLLFPRAKFVNLVRDGRAVVCSMLKSGFDEPFAHSFDEACRTWSFYAGRGLAFVSANSARSMTLRQEELIHQPEGAMSKVFDFLEVQSDAAAAAFLRAGHVNSSYGNAAGAGMQDRKLRSTLPFSPWSEWTEGERITFNELAGEQQKGLGYVV
jgi:protein-tyrosine sulfotransferase